MAGTIPNRVVLEYYKREREKEKEGIIKKPSDFDAAQLYLHVTALQKACKKLAKLGQYIEEGNKRMKKKIRKGKWNSEDFTNLLEKEKEQNNVYQEILVLKVTVESQFNESKSSAEGLPSENEGTGITGRHRLRSMSTLSLSEAERCEHSQQTLRKMSEMESEINGLKRKLEESESEKLALRLSHQDKIWELKQAMRRLNERIKKQEQVQPQATDKEQKSKEVLIKGDCEQLKTKVEESDYEKGTHKYWHEDEIWELSKEIRRLKDRLKISESKGKLHGDLETEVQRLKKQIQKLTEECRDLEKQKSEINARCSSLQTHITSYKENWTKSEDAKIRLEIKIKEKENVAKELEKKLEESEYEKVALGYGHQDEIGVLNEKIRRLKERTKERKHLQRQVTNTEQKEKEAIVKKEYTREKLSSMASVTLDDKIPIIPELSDPNRPTKIAEKLSEIYDNEWTDAFDHLEKSYSKMEKDSVQLLLDVLIHVHQECSNLSGSILENIITPLKPTDIPPEVSKNLKDAVKMITPYRMLAVAKDIKRNLLSLFDSIPGDPFDIYIDKCVDVCLHMSVQDPPMYLSADPDKESLFSSALYRAYTKSGKYEVFIVWPILYLHKNGPMLAKGVAQGTDDKTII